MSAETDIAVVGTGCRFPDAGNPAEFWDNLVKGVVSPRPLTDEELLAAGVAEEVFSAPDFVRVAARLPAAERFAAGFFGYTRAEAEVVDPQQRLFLEVCWEALESAGHAPAADGPVVGVFAGCNAGAYSTMLLAAKARTHGWTAAFDDMDLHLGGLGDFLASRVGYKLGLRGPTVGVQTACSSALYGVHYAVLSLLAGECDIALAGGAAVLEPLVGYRHQPGGVLSEDGYCRAFDARATGTVFSSGVGVVALRRLSDALADGDPVLAVVKGSAVGNDGADRNAFSAPNPAAVADVVRAALTVSDVDGSRLRYVEAHGTGTALGDRIELRALTLGTGAREPGSCGLGSVKVNIGHTGAAAGAAGLIKAVHVVSTGVLPPHPLFEFPRDPGALAESPFALSAEPGRCTDEDRHALVNSMGFGGTNAVVVLGPPPAPVRPRAAARDRVELVLSARTRTELDALSRAVATALDNSADPADVAHTLRLGRRSFAERRVVGTAPQRLPGALRVPRPPAARTARTSGSPGVALTVPTDGSASRAAVDTVRRALRGRVSVTSGPPPAGHFVIALGTPAPEGPGVALDAEPDADAIASALSAAWLAGADVDWRALDDGTGRRVALPTYPFRRERYWALDDLPPLTAPAPVPAAPAGDDLEAELVALWRELFGVDTVGVGDEFGALGGTSLLSVRMAVEVRQRYGVTLNLHRAGGSRATVRRIADVIRRAGDDTGSDGDTGTGSDAHLVDADLAIPLGEVAGGRTEGRDLLLTGATGFLGAFLLDALHAATGERIHCLVRAADEAAAWERLDAAAKRFALPAPDRDRVRVVVGDLADFERVHAADDGLSARVGAVVHCAARVVFTEPYRVLRADNVLPLAGLLRWMRRHGIRDLAAVSTIAATHYALGTHRVLETRDQPLDTGAGGYGTSKWVAERLLERCEKDGMRVRVFRPGYVLGSTRTGACNDKDLLWRVVAAALAVGAHPADGRGLPAAPVDVIARAIAELALAPGSAGRAYHLMDAVTTRQDALFDLLGQAGLPTGRLPLAQWRDRVRALAVATGNEVLATASALYDLEANDLGEHDVQTDAWQGWLRATGLSSAPTGELLRGCLGFLADRDPSFGELLADVIEQRSTP
ncbi:thioester reductase domain-containing protein [Saccharothrix syringae]|uniref:NAD-dependent epimerase/dehydratase family protein n=1 Tax=Saccharothrix syringae TaxID=103733 RepID=A0A5Q0H4R1_SACSY|nr:thioester reductase domain-containing protein [Saccharothrix syringae]QFZ20983.1 NAD-dependent epimerase/dehydratase family protein [Saccharothrix syringae]